MRILASTAIFALVIMLFVGFAMAQEQEMTMEEYNAQLLEWQTREAEAKTAITAVEGEIAALKAEIAQVEQETANEWQEIYAALGTDEAGVAEFRSSLNNIGSELDALAALSPEELFKQRKELDALEAKLNELMQSPTGKLTELEDMAAMLQGKISQLRASMPKAIYDEYTVVKGDYLWKISGKSDVYADPYQWMRIYTYNKDQIKNPNLIYADQIFKIQREVGPNEYLVVKGDYLAKIAGNPEIFNDPTKWTKIFEANKEIVSDQNMIYPYQVLVIPE
ncbi:LysM peptidoglycan-binding domain-containing protein [candidate division KSB1 bacterium]|nr:LysM peptidoglycan-binding domain-containing protein [candidate division KSB1 bacterium]